jgi:hypothetical protein
MIEIPENAVTEADLAEWYRLKNELAKIKQAEGLLRGKIFHYFFPNPKEGTNKHKLKDGTGAELKATHVINRSVDIGSLTALKAAIAEESSNLPKLPIDELIKWEPKLVKKEYNELTEEEKHVFDQCLVIKDGSPSLEIVIPKRNTP